MPQRPVDVLLNVRRLRKSFGTVEAVRDLSLEVRRGEVFGLLGPNGAGKTTTIRMLAGLLRADGGEIEVDGISLRKNPRACRRRIGLCPQELILWEGLTCLEQLTFVGVQYDLGWREARRRSLQLLDALGLWEKARRKAGSLSGGMKRRLNLALALVHEPDLLILDEPQAGLDPQSRIMVREYIQSLARSRTVLLTTHEMDEADRLAHRLAILDHGQLLVLDSPAGLKDRYASGEILEVGIRVGLAPGPRGEDRGLEVFMASLPPKISLLESLPGTLRLTGPDLHGHIPELLQRMADEGLQPGGVTLRNPTLEDVFVTLTGRGLRE